MLEGFYSLLNQELKPVGRRDILDSNIVEDRLELGESFILPDEREHCDAFR